MSNTATAINLNALGIQDIKKAVEDGYATVSEAFAVVHTRITNRQAKGMSLLRPVVEYRNELVESLNASNGSNIPPLPLPTYPAKAQANASLPTDPEQLADLVFSTVGAANVGLVISRLTARVVGA